MKLTKTCAKFLRKHGGTILAIGASAGVVLTAIETVPASPDEWLEQFNTFSIYEILPQLIDLWGLNVETQVKSKKNIARLTDR